jgi:4-hydroxybenzoate polyprenyltransferase
LVGVRSSALALGSRVKPGVAVFYALALALWGAAVWQIRPDCLVLAALLPAAAHFAWQVATLVPADGANALHRFRSNRYAGLLIFLACFVVGQTSF